MRKLFLDDERTPEQVIGWMTNREPDLVHLYSEKDWSVVTSFYAFCDWVRANGVPDVVSFDHDLGGIKELTGFECAKWLKLYCRTTGVEYPKILIHTMNPVSGTRIRGVFI